MHEVGLAVSLLLVFTLMFGFLMAAVCSGFKHANTQMDALERRRSLGIYDADVTKRVNTQKVMGVEPQK